MPTINHPHDQSSSELELVLELVPPPRPIAPHISEHTDEVVMSTETVEAYQDLMTVRRAVCRTLRTEPGALSAELRGLLVAESRAELRLRTALTALTQISESRAAQSAPTDGD